jgi:hypothetical protein
MLQLQRVKCMIRWFKKALTSVLVQTRQVPK